jgi:hypothetical protein
LFALGAEIGGIRRTANSIAAMYCSGRTLIGLSQPLNGAHIEHWLNPQNVRGSEAGLSSACRVNPDKNQTCCKQWNCNHEMVSAFAQITKP